MDFYKYQKVEGDEESSLIYNRGVGKSYGLSMVLDLHNREIFNGTGDHFILSINEHRDFFFVGSQGIYLLKKDICPKCFSTSEAIYFRNKYISRTRGTN